MKLISLYSAGVLSLFFGIFHITFWKMLSWKETLQKLDHINRGVMQMLNIVVAYLFLYFGLFSFIAAHSGPIDIMARSQLLFIAGVYVIRFVFGFWLFRLSRIELIVRVLCIIAAGLYGISFYSPGLI